MHRINSVTYKTESRTTASVRKCRSLWINSKAEKYIMKYTD